MTDASKVLGDLATDKQKALNGVILSLELMTATVRRYTLHFERSGADGATARIPLLKQLNDIIGGLTSSEAQLSLIGRYERADIAGRYDDTPADVARDQVVALACSMSDLRACNCVRDETVLELVDDLAVAVQLMEDAEEAEETEPGIIGLDPEPSPEELAELACRFGVTL